MFQMTSSALETDLHPLHKIVNHSHALLSGDFPDFCWGAAPPEEVLQRPLHSIKCTAWVAISTHGIIGPYSFEDENERAQTVNTERYVAVLRKFWTSLGRRRGFYRDDQWFQQDGATPHTSNHTLDWLRERFQERLISRDQQGSAGSVTSSGHLIHRT